MMLCGYLLVQRAMGLGLALDAAQSRIQQLEAQCAQQLDQLAQLQRNQTTPATAADANGSWMSGSQAWGRGAETPAQSWPSSTARFTPPAPLTARTAAMPAQGHRPGMGTEYIRKRPVRVRVGPSLINSCVIETICEAEVEPWIVWCRYLLRIIYRPGHRL